MSLPNFFIVGAPKAGTTSLYHYLREHPEIYMSREKEPNFFSHREIQNQNLYYKKKNIKTFEDYQQLFDSVVDEKAIGEASVSYLYYQSVPHKIFKRIPGAKIIIILRNPVDRAYSHYLMDLRLGYISASLEDVIHKKIKNKNSDLFLQQYLELGLYHEPVKRYLTTFKIKNVKVLIFDEFEKNSKKIINSICDFLNVERIIFTSPHQKYNEPIIPKNSMIHFFYTVTFLRKLMKSIFSESFIKKMKVSLFEKKKPLLNEGTKDFLKSYYSQDIKRLSDLIKKDLGYWLT